MPRFLYASPTNVPAATVSREHGMRPPPAAPVVLHVRVVPYLDDPLRVAARHEQASHVLSLLSLCGKSGAAVPRAGGGRDGQAGDPIGVCLDLPYCQGRGICLPVFATVTSTSADALSETALAVWSQLEQRRGSHKCRTARVKIDADLERKTNENTRGSGRLRREYHSMYVAM